jgi:hypothetical protein
MNKIALAKGLAEVAERGAGRLGSSMTTMADWAKADPKWTSSIAQLGRRRLTPRYDMGAPLNLTKVRPQYSMNPQPFGMKMAAVNFIAQSINDELTKEATGLGGTLASVLSPARGLVTGLMGKAAPALEKGFGAIGSQAYKLPEGGMLSKLLTGGSAPTYDVGERTFLNAPELGRTVAKRVGIGTGVGAAGVLGAEAPFKAENNAAYEQQQEHPLRAWLAQHLAGAPKLQHKSYLNPFSM